MREEHRRRECSGASLTQHNAGPAWISQVCRRAAVVIFSAQQSPTGMGLASDIGLRGVILGVEGIKVLLQPLLSRDTGIDRAANRRFGCHAMDPFDGLSRRPKNRGPFQRVPVIAKATAGSQHQGHPTGRLVRHCRTNADPRHSQSGILARVAAAKRQRIVSLIPKAVC